MTKMPIFFIQSPEKRKYKRKRILSPSVCAVLDRFNTSVQKGTMVMASVINRAGSSTSSTVLSKSTIHRQRQRQREKTGTAIKENYVPATCIVHWDSKLMPESSNKSPDIVDRLPILVTSIEDAETKLLCVPASLMVFEP